MQKYNNGIMYSAQLAALLTIIIAALSSAACSSDSSESPAPSAATASSTALAYSDEEIPSSKTVEKELMAQAKKDLNTSLEVLKVEKTDGMTETGGRYTVDYRMQFKILACTVYSPQSKYHGFQRLINQERNCKAPRGLMTDYPVYIGEDAIVSVKGQARMGKKESGWRILEYSMETPEYVGSAVEKVATDPVSAQDIPVIDPNLSDTEKNTIMWIFMAETVAKLFPDFAAIDRSAKAFCQANAGIVSVSTSGEGYKEFGRQRDSVSKRDARAQMKILEAVRPGILICSGANSG